MLALIRIAFSVLRNPVGAAAIALVVGYGYGGIKWYERGVRHERAAAVARVAELNRDIDKAMREIAAARAAEDATREAAYNEAVDHLRNSDAACLVSPELAEKLNAIH